MTKSLPMGSEHLVIPINDIHLNGLLNRPKNAKSIVLFVHGSGSSRFSVRNQRVATVLNEAKFATLLFDLLTPEEETADEKTRELRFNIELLASRLQTVTTWILQQPATAHLEIGYFGASTGGGAALVAAANKPERVKAVVSRGGRPDLAGKALSHVKAPMLLIVGSNDEPVIEMNRNAMAKMHCVSQLGSVDNSPVSS